MPDYVSRESLLAEIPGATVQYVQGWGRSLNLASFVSTYAAPGQMIAFSDGSDIQGNINGAQMSTIDQATRQRNFRIYMEAQLRTTGGTGAANGAGWYSTGNNSSQEATPGALHIPGPFWIEPHDTSGLPGQANYAPNFAATGKWTNPALITLWGSGKSAAGGSGNPNVAWNGWRSRLGPRIITVNAEFGWNPRGGPTVVGGGNSRNVNGWEIDGIGLARRGSTNGDVFWSGYYHDGIDIFASDFWRIRSLFIDQDSNLYSGSPTIQNGFVIRGGMDAFVDDLAVFGGDNEGYGIIHTSGIDNAGTGWAGLSLTVFYRKVLVQGSKRGVGFCMANCFMENLNLESPEANTHQLALTSCNSARIGYLHTESLADPTWSDESTLLCIGRPATAAVLGGVNNTQWNGASVVLGNAVVQGAYNPFVAPTPENPDPWAGNAESGVTLHLGHLMMEGILDAHGLTSAILRVNALNANDGNAVLDFNSRMIRSGSAGRFIYNAGRINNRNSESIGDPNVLLV